MEQWQSGFVETEGPRLHYTRSGGDKPPLVLAHGVTDDGLCWTPLAAALADDYDTIMVDARGHGRSSAPEQGYGPGAQADDLAALIAALGLSKPAVLGHSMGAATSLALAGAYPDVPGAILLEDPVDWWIEDRETTETLQHRTEMKAHARGLQERTHGELIAECRTANPAWPNAELTLWADAKLRFSPRVLTVYDANNPSDVDWDATLRQITCPALLITGDPDLGGIVTEESAAELHALVPGLEIAHIPGAGHNIRREQFAEYLDVVRAFLTRHRAIIGG